MQWIRHFVRDDRAQDLIEYALVVGFLSFATLVGVAHVSAGMTGAYASITAGIQPAAGGPGSGAASDGFRVQQSGSVTVSATCAGHQDERTSACPSTAAK